MIFVFLFGCAAVSGAVASHKNRGVAGWAALGFFLGVVGVVITICQKSLPMPNAMRASMGSGTSSRAELS
ncbi:MAG TPA: hypothetical protein VGM39_08750 [Kofleriaceae bacterium]|jgi:hypothetical protein